MSMLAETRKKLKWSQDPNNKFWENDSSRFGLKMMSKMGWSQGKGLGAREHGSQSHIKISRRADNRGIGATAAPGDNWLETQDAFNSLLKQLNKNVETGVDAKAVAVVEEAKSLREKADSSRRIFYSKFLKNKEASSYSSEDMASIFGVKPSREGSTVTSGAATPASAQSDESEKDASSSDVKTTTSTNDVHSYFAQRMAALGYKGSASVPAERKSSGSDSDSSEEERAPSFGGAHVSSSSAEESPRKRKRSESDDSEGESGAAVTRDAKKRKQGATEVATKEKKSRKDKKEKKDKKREKKEKMEKKKEAKGASKGDDAARDKEKREKAERKEKRRAERAKRKAEAGDAEGAKSGKERKRSKSDA